MYSAIEVAKCGGPEVLKLVQRVLPTSLKPNEILVQVFGSGVNPVDTYLRSGGQGYSPSLPYTPGYDLAGEVTLAGDKANRFKAGSRIYALKPAVMQGVHTGGYAQYCVMDEALAHTLPDNVTYQQGACLGVPYYTAYKAFLRGDAKLGETVLVHGGSGGVGLAACQLARCKGMKVLATAGTQEGMDVVRSCGVEHVFNHKEEGYLNKIKECCPGGVDLVLEMAAHINLQHDLQLMAQHGRIMIIGSRGDIVITPRMTMTKDSDIRGVRFAGTTEAELQEIETFLEAGLTDGSLSPIVDHAYPLEMAAQAHVDIIEKKGARGNLVITPHDVE